MFANSKNSWQRGLLFPPRTIVTSKVDGLVISKEKSISLKQVPEE